MKERRTHPIVLDNAVLVLYGGRFPCNTDIRAVTGADCHHGHRLWSCTGDCEVQKMLESLKAGNGYQVIIPDYG